MKPSLLGIVGLLFFATFCAAQDAVTAPGTKPPPTLFTVTSSPTTAPASAPTATEEVTNSDLKEATDPTILTRRVWFETEWNKFDNGSSVLEETLGTLWAWRISADQDFAVRLKVPFKFRVGADDPELSGFRRFWDYEDRGGQGASSG